jgi:hypothetical protein
LQYKGEAGSGLAGTRNTATVAVSTDWMPAGLLCALLQLDDASLLHDNVAAAAQHLRSLLSSASKTRKQVRHIWAPAALARASQQRIYGWFAKLNDIGVD